MIAVYLVWKDGCKNFLGYAYTEGGARRMWKDLLHSDNKLEFI